MRTSGEKVRLSDEAERVQSVSYCHIKSLSGLYTVVCVFKWRQAMHLPRAPLCNRNAYSSLTYFQRGPTAIAMYKWATLLSKGRPTAVVMCKYLAFKRAQRNCNALFLQRAS